MQKNVYTKIMADCSGRSAILPRMKAIAVPLLVVLALGIGVPTTYAASYYLSCDYSMDCGAIMRRYRWEWQRIVFEPGARIEAHATGRVVLIPNNFR